LGIADGARRECFDGSTERILKGPSMIKAILSLVIIFFVATFPATWLLMLFLGNVGMGLGYWGALPLGVLVSVLLSGATAPTYVFD
jgi:hypothetical protein